MPPITSPREMAAMIADAVLIALEAAGRRRRMNGTVERVTPKENEDACS